MRKALVILVAVALLGVAAAYVNPLGPESPSSLATKTSSSSSSPTGTTTNTTATPTAGSSSQAPTSAQASAYKDGTYQGDTYSSRYGDVQLSVVIQNGKITNVKTDVLTEYDPQSQQIDNYAVPQLKSQALAAQNANIDGISGASFTSSSYQQSLQSALDKARA